MPNTGKSYTLLMVLALMLLLPLPGAAQRLAVKTNLLSLAGATPDLGFEVVTGEHASFSLTAFGTVNPYWRDKSLGEEVQTTLFAVQPEFRYWFNGRPLTRFFTGVNALAAAYDFSMVGRLHKGNAAGIGLTAGYVINLTKRLDVEFSTGAGLLFYWGKRYADGTPLPLEDEMPDTWGYKLSPTKLGITLVYIIK